MSAKNSLQEFLQQRGRPLPLYTSDRVQVGVTAMWRSVVNVEDHEFVGEPCTTKVASDATAAAVALAALARGVVRRVLTPPRADANLDIYIHLGFPTSIVDDVLKALVVPHDGTVMIHVFVLSSHPLAAKRWDHPCLVRHVVADRVPSGIDPALCVEVGRQMSIRDDCDVIIVTGGHAAPRGPPATAHLVTCSAPLNTFQIPDAPRPEPVTGEHFGEGLADYLTSHMGVKARAVPSDIVYIMEALQDAGWVSLL